MISTNIQIISIIETHIIMLLRLALKFQRILIEYEKHTQDVEQGFFFFLFRIVMRDYDN